MDLTDEPTENYHLALSFMPCFRCMMQLSSTRSATGTLLNFMFTAISLQYRWDSS